MTNCKDSATRQMSEELANAFLAARNDVASRRLHSSDGSTTAGEEENEAETERELEMLAPSCDNEARKAISCRRSVGRSVNWVPFPFLPSLKETLEGGKQQQHRTPRPSLSRLFVSLEQKLVGSRKLHFHLFGSRPGEATKCSLGSIRPSVRRNKTFALPKRAPPPRLRCLPTRRRRGDAH